MPVLLNSAGASAADPILDGLPLDLVIAASSMDVATFNDAFVDQASGFPGTNSVKASVSPASTVVTAGASGSYNDTSKEWTISDTTGLAAGDYIYLSHVSITDGIYPIATIVDGTNFTVDGNPGDGGGNLSSVAYQVAWVWQTTAGASPQVSSAGGTQNYLKADLEDGDTNNTQAEDDFYVRGAPAGASYITVEGGSYTGTTVTDTLLTLAILSAWTNNGGVTHLELANHSVQSQNDFTWTTGGGTGEKTLAQAEGGLTASGGDGMKYGRLLLKSKSGGDSLGVDIDVNLDSTGPTIVLSAFGG